MKTATIFTHVVSVKCPYCSEFTHGENGSMDFKAANIKDKMTCSNCDRVFKTGKAIALF